MKTQLIKKIATLALLFFLLPAFSYAQRVKLTVSPSSPFLFEGQDQKTYLKIGLTGFEIKKKNKRTPVNIALVLDRSGSMSGEKLQRAKDAAKLAIDLLGKNDIVSIITYDNVVSVLIPATKVSNKKDIKQKIDQIYAGGSTALFAGVSKGAEEIRKFINKNRVNRIILLSDGLANVGPSTPGALAELGSSLIKEGVSVSTIGLGLGYNEDLMSKLAQKSDGNHAFVQHPKDLAKIFNQEFGDVLSVVAQNVHVKIRCPEGVRPIRTLGRDSEISGQEVTVSMNQLYSNQEKYILLEVIISAKKAKKKIQIASVNLKYNNTVSKKEDSFRQVASVAFTKSKQKIEQTKNKEVLVAAVTQIATEKHKKALALRDRGEVKAARSALRQNSMYLEKQAKELKSEDLKKDSARNFDDSKNLQGSSWNARRKMMKKFQHKKTSQQSY
ncbi:MAG: Ca-activated chloride channel family protein [bacterium]|jgi:Ca-activated chloride channel family protein